MSWFFWRRKRPEDASKVRPKVPPSIRPTLSKAGSTAYAEHLLRQAVAQQYVRDAEARIREARKRDNFNTARPFPVYPISHAIVPAPTPPARRDDPQPTNGFDPVAAAMTLATAPCNPAAAVLAGAIGGPGGLAMGLALGGSCAPANAATPPAPEPEPYKGGGGESGGGGSSSDFSSGFGSE